MSTLLRRTNLAGIKSNTAIRSTPWCLDDFQSSPPTKTRVTQPGVEVSKLHLPNYIYRPWVGFGFHYAVRREAPTGTGLQRCGSGVFGSFSGSSHQIQPLVRGRWVLSCCTEDLAEAGRAGRMQKHSRSRESREDAKAQRTVGSLSRSRWKSIRPT